MPVLGKVALAVVAGGVALGTLLGAAANPVMKKPPEQPWQAAMQAPVVADPGYRIMVEAPPEDLSPYQDSYAPTWAREELADWEPDYPAWTYSELVDEASPEPSTAEPQANEQPAAQAPGPAEPLAQQTESEPATVVSERHAPANLAALY